MRGVWKRSHGRATKAPPDERAANRYARPTAAAPHSDSTDSSRPLRANSGRSVAAYRIDQLDPNRPMSTQAPNLTNSVLKGDSKAPPFSPRTPPRSECFSGAAPRGAQSSLRCPQSRVMQGAPEQRQPLEMAHIQAFVRASRKRGMTGFESDCSAEKSKPIGDAYEPELAREGKRLIATLLLGES